MRDGLRCVDRGGRRRRGRRRGGRELGEGEERREWEEGRGGKEGVERRECWRGAMRGGVEGLVRRALARCAWSVCSERVARSKVKCRDTDKEQVTCRVAIRRVACQRLLWRGRCTGRGKGDAGEVKVVGR